MDGTSSPGTSFSPCVEESAIISTERRKSTSKVLKSPKERPLVDFHVVSHEDLLEQAEEYRKKYRKLTVELNRIRDERNVWRDKYAAHKSERAQWDHEKTKWIEQAKEWGDKVEKEKNEKKELEEKISFLGERNKALTRKLQEKDETQKATDDRVLELEKDIEDILKCDKSTSEYKLPHVFRQRILEQAEKITYHELQNSLLLQQLEDNQFEIREMQRAQKRSLNAVNGVGKSKEVSSRSPAEKKATKTATPVSKKSNTSVSKKRPKNEDNGEYSREMNDRSRYTPIGDDCKRCPPEAFQTPSQCSKRPAQETMKKANNDKRPLPQFEEFLEGPLSWDSLAGNRGMIERGNPETRHQQRSTEGIRPSMNSVNEIRFDRPPSNEPYYFTSQSISPWVQPSAISRPSSYLPIDPGSNQDSERGYFNPSRSSYGNESDVWLGQRDSHRGGMNDTYGWNAHRSGYNGPTFNPDRSQFF